MEHDHLQAGLAAAQSAHQQQRKLLPEYAMATIERKALDSRWNELQAHLARCNDCQSEFTELCALLEATYSGLLIPARNVPPPDLSFLKLSTEA